MQRRVYIGWDSREDIAYQVCKHSILKHSPNIEVIPLKLDELKKRGLVTRPDDPKASTEFTFTRFLVPYLNDYKGLALFVDCDFLFRSDVNKIFDLGNSRHAVSVVKHEYNVENGSVKMDGKVQHAYPRKNWSSCMLFNCGHVKNINALDPFFINQYVINGMPSMSFLHQFKWLADEDIGDLPKTWNWLVGHYHEPQDGIPDAIHYTLGGPWFEQYKDVEYGNLWLEAEQEYYKSW